MSEGEQREGNTGVWTFVLATDDGKILATSNWGTNYLFNREQWEALPLISHHETTKH